MNSFMASANVSTPLDTNVTQADIRPPRFVVFSTGFLEAGYRRFLERKLRERWGFEGTPIDISVKVRETKARDLKRS